MQIKIETNPDRIRVTVPGHSWSNGIKAPVIEGWEPYWVSHFGHERTEYTYRRETPAEAELKEAGAPFEIVGKLLVTADPEPYGGDDDDRAYDRSQS